jgi:magnesium transporter
MLPSPNNVGTPLMPELNWVGGYPFGLAMIVLSSLIPVAWFKWRGWF